MGNRVIFSSLLFHDFIQQYISKMRIDSCTELIPLSIPGSQFLLTFFLVPKFCLSKNVCKIVMLKQREYQLTEIPCNQPHWRCPAHSRTCAEKRLGQHVTGFLRPYLYKTTLVITSTLMYAQLIRAQRKSMKLYQKHKNILRTNSRLLTFYDLPLSKN